MFQKSSFFHFVLLASLVVGCEVPELSDDETGISVTSKDEPVAMSSSIALEQSADNLRKIARAIFYYQSDNKYRYPPRYLLTKEGKPGLSWRVALLPMLAQEKLYAKFKLDEPWDSDTNRKLLASIPKVYQSTRHDASASFTNYLAISGKEAMFSDEHGRQRGAVMDGTSNTISILEVDDSKAVEWTKPADLDWDREEPAKGLGAGSNSADFLFVLADSSVHVMPTSVDPTVLAGMFTPNGKEAIDVNALLPTITRSANRNRPSGRKDSAPKSKETEVPQPDKKVSSEKKLQAAKFVTYFAFDSTRFCYVGQGQTGFKISEVDGWKFYTSRNQNGTIIFSISRSQEGRQETWEAHLRPPYDRPFELKLYENAMRADFSPAGSPWLWMVGGSRGPDNTSGWFKIHEADFSSNNKHINHFSVDFVQVESNGAQVFGRLRYKASIDPVPTEEEIEIALHTKMSQGQELMLLRRIDLLLKSHKGQYGRLPKSHEEFLKEIVEKNHFFLPSAKAGLEYWFNPEDGQLIKRTIRDEKP